jgi:hypothetical protein
MITTDYTGRTVDVLAYRPTYGKPAKSLIAALADETTGGEIVTGIQKLAQRFMLELFTENGTMSYLPDRGCSFMTEARQGGWQTTIDVMAAFSAAIVDISKNLLNEESSLDPDDERYKSAELLSVTLSAGSLAITVKLTSLAETSWNYVLPIATTI